MIRTAIALVLVLAAPALDAAGWGRLSSLVGEVTIVRGGAAMDAGAVNEGTETADFDTIITGANGGTRVLLGPDSGFEGTLLFGPGTVAVLDHSSSDPRLTVDLVVGTVSCDIQSAGNHQYRVTVGPGSMVGTRGRATVVADPWGHALFASSLGPFLVSGESEAMSTSPGTVVELSESRHLPRATAVNPATLDAFVTTWLEQQTASARGRGESIFVQDARAYELQLGSFQRAWERWKRHKDEAQDLGSVAIGLRRAERPLTRSFYRLMRLQAWFQDGTLSPRLEVRRDYSIDQFFHQWAQDRTTWLPRLEEARALYRAAQEANNGQFPHDEANLEITWDSGYFH